MNEHPIISVDKIIAPLKKNYNEIATANSHAIDK